jgi:hypothetical protein
VHVSAVDEITKSRVSVWSRQSDGVVERSWQREQAAGNTALTESDERERLHLGPVIVADYAATLGSDLATNFSTDPHRIHPSPTGNVVYADLLERTLDTCPPPAAATTPMRVPTTSDPTTIPARLPDRWPT